MTEKMRVRRTPFLPLGIAMLLLSLGFTFGATGVRWLWGSEPVVAVILAAAGAVFIAVHVVQRSRHAR